MISRRESFKVFASGAAVGLTGAVFVTSCAPTEAPAAGRSIASMFDEWRALHDRECRGETADEADAAHERYCALQEAIIRAEPKTPHDLAMMAYADNGGGVSNFSDEFGDRLLAMALKGRVS